MARRTDMEMLKARERWKEMLWREEFYNSSNVEQAKVIGVSSAAIGQWKNDASDEFWKKYVDSFRDKVQGELGAVLMAMIKEAKGGSVAAAELVLKRIEGWSPKQTNENIERHETDGMSVEEQFALVAKALGPEKLKELMTKAVDLKVVEPGKVVGDEGCLGTYGGKDAAGT